MFLSTRSAITSRTQLGSQHPLHFQFKIISLWFVVYSWERCSDQADVGISGIPTYTNQEGNYEIETCMHPQNSHFNPRKEERQSRKSSSSFKKARVCALLALNLKGSQLKCIRMLFHNMDVLFLSVGRRANKAFVQYF